MKYKLKEVSQTVEALQLTGDIGIIPKGYYLVNFNDGRSAVMSPADFERHYEPTKEEPKGNVPYFFRVQYQSEETLRWIDSAHSKAGKEFISYAQASEAREYAKQDFPKLKYRIVLAPTNSAIVVAG